MLTLLVAGTIPVVEQGVAPPPRHRAALRRLDLPRRVYGTRRRWRRQPSVKPAKSLARKFVLARSSTSTRRATTSVLMVFWRKH
jgi:hypothetical protein